MLGQDLDAVGKFSRVNVVNHGLSQQNQQKFSAASHPSTAATAGKAGQIGPENGPDSLTAVELLAENEGHNNGSGESPGLNQFAFSGLRLN